MRRQADRRVVPPAYERVQGRLWLTSYDEHRVDNTERRRGNVLGINRNQRDSVELRRHDRFRWAPGRWQQVVRLIDDDPMGAAGGATELQ